MKRKRSFFIALGSAAATFGILFATMGKPHHCGHHQHCDRGHNVEQHHHR